MKLKTGQVLLFDTGKGLFPFLIRKYNKSIYGESVCHHAAIISNIKDGIVYVHEPLSYSGVKVYQYEDWWLLNKIKEGKIIVMEAKVKLKDVEKHANEYLGIKYGIVDILTIGLYWLTRLKISLTKKNRLICSEFVVRVLYDASDKKINFEKEFKQPFDLIDPMELYYSKQLKRVKW